MKQLHFQTLNNLSLLHDDILAAVPSLKPVPNIRGELDPNGNIALEPVMVVRGNEANVWLEVPDSVDEAAIAAVVQSHDHTKTQPDPRKERLARIAEINSIARSDWTSAQMRELISLMAQELIT